MRPLRVLVADDEPLARELVCDLVARDPELSVVAEAGDGNAVSRGIERHAPDIVILDIEMPECTGLEAARKVRSESPPVFIMVTAYERYAQEAFEIEALDYVLKPVDEERLAHALERAKQRVGERRRSRIAEQVATLTANLDGVEELAEARGEDAYLTRLPIRAKGRTLIIRVEDIVWIESQDYYVRVHTERHRPLLRASLASLERRLDPRHFCRVHRGAIVNLNEVAELQHLFKGVRAVLLSDGTQLRVSRSRRRQVENGLTPRFGA